MAFYKLDEGQEKSIQPVNQFEEENKFNSLQTYQTRDSQREGRKYINKIEGLLKRKALINIAR